MTKVIKSFKVISILEALSFLVLLFVAYIYRMPEMVSILGPAHGALFIAYIVMAIYVSTLLKWNLKTLAIVIFCSILPFGPFYADKKYLP